MISSISIFWINKRFEKSLKSEITFWITILTNSRKTIDWNFKTVVYKYLARFLKILLEIILNFFEQEHCVFQERKNTFVSSDQDQSTFSSRTVFSNYYWSFEVDWDSFFIDLIIRLSLLYIFFITVVIYCIEVLILLRLW